MKKSGFSFLSLATALAFVVAPAITAPAADTNTSPGLNEILPLLRAHLAGATEDSLNRAAVDGLLANLRGKAWLADVDSGAAATNLITRSSVLDDGVAYLRAGKISGAPAPEFGAALKELASTNKLKGLVLDLDRKSVV